MARTRIWIDSTFTFDSPLKAGVARVVDKISDWLPKVVRDSDADCEIVIYRDGCFQLAHRQVGLAWWDYKRLRKHFSKCLPQWYRRSSALLPRPIRSWLAPCEGKLGLFLAPVASLACGLWFYRKITIPRRRAKLAAGDILLLPDGYWATRRIWPGVQRARRQGLKIAFVVYDLIATKNPEFFGPGFHKIFESYLRSVCQSAHLVLTISRTVAEELRTYLQTNQSGERIPHIATFQLGSDFETLEKSFDSRHNEVRAPIRRVLDLSIPKFLVVSTIEPRKNHALVLDAFEQVWQLDDACLIIAGRLGWMFEGFIHRAQQHPLWNSRLFHFDDLADHELVACYKGASAVICPSLAEGFGLTNVEALRFGKVVFASDIPIHREVGGKHCTYFGKNDSKMLANVIREHCRSGLDAKSMLLNREDRSLSGAQPRDAESRQITTITWETSIRQLANSLLSTQEGL